MLTKRIGTIFLFNMKYNKIISLLVAVSYCYCVTSMSSAPPILKLNETVQANNLSSVMSPDLDEEDVLKPLIRVKKADETDSGTGKYTTAAKMPQLKVLRLFLQLFKNSWDETYVGGTHPLHPNVPKAVLTLYKQRIVDFFFPRIGVDPRKAG